MMGISMINEAANMWGFGICRFTVLPYYHAVVILRLHCLAWLVERRAWFDNHHLMDHCDDKRLLVKLRQGNPLTIIFIVQLSDPSSVLDLCQQNLPLSLSTKIQLTQISFHFIIIQLLFTFFVLVDSFWSNGSWEQIHFYQRQIRAYKLYRYT